MQKAMVVLHIIGQSTRQCSLAIVRLVLLIFCISNLEFQEVQKISLKLRVT